VELSPRHNTFFLLSLIYGGYAVDRRNLGLSGAEDTIQAVVSFIQAIMLGSFSLLLTAHRTEIMDRTSTLHKNSVGTGTGASAGDNRNGGGASDGFREVEMNDNSMDESTYDPPNVVS
jgi:hypothetical protein